MYLGNIYPTWRTVLRCAAAVRKIKLHAPPVGSAPCGSRSFHSSISVCRNIQMFAACVRPVNGASCFHLPFALARAGKFYPSITYYGKNENFGNVFEKNFKKFFKRQKKPGCGLCSVGCALGSFFFGGLRVLPPWRSAYWAGKFFLWLVPFQ